MKINQKNKSYLAVFCLLLFGQTLHAQSVFKYKAGLPVIDSSGFYLINLKPALIAKTMPGLVDLRLRDGKGKFVPYIAAESLLDKDTQHFRVFPQVSFTSNLDTGTVYVISNSTRLTVSEIWLRLRNTAVSRQVTLSGSEDLKNWYAIKENVPLETSGANRQSAYEQLLQFPSSNYRYLKILVDDKNKVPIKILQAGIYVRPAGQRSYIELPKPVFMQKDTGNVSRIVLQFKDTYVLDKLQLHFTGPKFFRRRIAVNQLEANRRYQLADAEILSVDVQQEVLIHGRGPKIELVIYNGDNPALKLHDIHVYQTRQSVVSYLEKGEKYDLVFGNPKASEPNYDIRFFTDSINTELPEISTADLMNNPVTTATRQKADLTWLIWTAALAALALLTFITFRMVKEVGKRSSGQ